MKRVTQFICAFLAIAVFLAIPAFAAEYSPRASYFFGSYSSNIEEVTSTKFNVHFRVTAVKGMDELGVSKIYVQRSADGTNWETMQTYSKEDYSNLICLNTGTHSGYVTYSNRSSGYRYRARVDYYAKLGTDTATYIDYTTSIS